MSGINWYATLDNKEFLARLNQCSENIKKTSAGMKKEGATMDAVFKKLAQAAASFGAAFSAKELITSITKVRGEFQSLETAFRVMLGNTEQANALMEQLTKTAATTPFALTDVTAAAKQLLAYGVAAEDVNATLIKLGDISSGLAIPLGDLTYLYGTTMAQGRLYTQDLNQFTNRGIPMISELAKQFGVATSEVKKLVEEGKVGFPEVEAAINSLTGEGSKFGGLMAEQAKGINGLISNLGDAVDRMFNSIGKDLQPQIESVLKGAQNVVNNYEQVGKVLMEGVAVWGAYKVACAAAYVAMYKHSILMRSLLTILPKLTALQKALNATMLSNPYVLAATALTALVMVMINATDSTKDLEKAQSEYQAKLDILIQKEEEQKRVVESLISVAENEALSTEERLDAIRSLHGYYPQIFGSYSTEYEMLQNILTIKKAIAEQDKANSITVPQNELKMVEQTIAELEAKQQEYAAKMKEQYGSSYTGTSPWAYSGLSKEEEAALKNLQTRRRELQKEVSKAEAEAYFANLAGISNEQLSAMIDERESLLAKIAVGEAADNKTHVGKANTGYQGTYTADELQKQLSQLEAESARRSEPLSTNTERLAKAQQEYLAAQQAYNEFLNDSSTQMRDTDAAKKADELKAAVKAAKAEVDKWGGSTRAASTGASAVADDYAEQVSAAQAGEEALAELRAKNRETEISLMEDSFEQKLATIQKEYDEELQAAAEQQKKLADANGGTLTDEMAEELANMRELAEQVRTKALNDAISDEIASFKERVTENETYQQRRLAIAEKYAQLIAAAESPEQKTELEQQKNAALNNAKIEAVISEIDWQAALGNTTDLFKGQLETLLSQLRAYMKSGEFAASSVEDKQIVVDAVDRLNTEIGTGTDVGFAALREKAEAVGSAFDDVASAKQDEEAAYDALLAAQQEYSDALASDDTSRISVAENRKNAAQETADMSTASYVAAKDTLSERSQDFSNSLAQTKNGLDEVNVGLQQLSGQSLTSVYNGLRSFVDGLEKLQVGKRKNKEDKGGEGEKSDEEDKESLLSEMSEKISSTKLGEVISIADVFSEGISPILTNMVDTVLSAATNVLDDILSLDIFTDLFSSIGSGLASLGNTLTFGLISGLRNSNAAEVQEITDRLTASNETLTNAIDKLTDEISSTGGLTAVSAAEEATEDMEQVIEQTMEILQENMSMHDKHHSNAYYWNLSESDYASLNETLADYAEKYGEGAKASVVSSLEDIYGLTPEEMDYIRTYNITMWEKMLDQGKYDMSEYWEDYADLAGELEEIEETLNETLTQTTFEDIRSNFLDTLTDMESDAADFSEDFEDMMREAVVNAMLSDLFDEEIQAFYDEFAEVFTGGIKDVSTSDIEALRDKYESLADEIQETTDYYLEVLGLDDGTSAAAQASSELTVEATQESVDEANGRLTALCELQNQTITQLSSLNEVGTTLANRQYNLTEEIRQALVTSNRHLEEIYDRQKANNNTLITSLDSIYKALT